MFVNSLYLFFCELPFCFLGLLSLGLKELLMLRKLVLWLLCCKCFFLFVLWHCRWWFFLLPYRNLKHSSLQFCQCFSLQLMNFVLDVEECCFGGGMFKILLVLNPRYTDCRVLFLYLQPCVPCPWVYLWQWSSWVLRKHWVNGENTVRGLECGFSQVPWFEILIWLDFGKW